MMKFGGKPPIFCYLSPSGVTEQLGALSNLLRRGPLRRQIDQQSSPNFQHQNGVFIGKINLSPAHQNLHNRPLWKYFNDGTFAQETYSGQWLKLNDCEASYIWGSPSGKFFEPCSLEYQEKHLSLSFHHQCRKKDSGRRHASQWNI